MTYRKFDWNRARSDFFTIFTDFLTFVAGDWVITKVGTGTTAIDANDPGGILTVTNTAADNDAISLQYAGGSGAAVLPFQVIPGKKVQAVFRGSVSDATQSDFMFGLLVTDTTPHVPAATAIMFEKTDGATEFIARHNGVAVNTGVNMANATMFELEIYYDGSTDDTGAAGPVQFYINKTRVAKIPLAAALADIPLTITFGLINGEAVAKIMLVDYVGVSQQR